jgi:hypothetical protein
MQSGNMVLQRLDEGKDGVWRSSGEVYEERADALVAVRCQFIAAAQSGKAPGFKLLTLRSKILDTELRE